MTEEEGGVLGLFDGLCPEFPLSGLDAAGCFVARWDVLVLGTLLFLVGLGVFLFLRHRDRAPNTPFLLPSAPEEGGWDRPIEPLRIPTLPVGGLSAPSPEPSAPAPEPPAPPRPIHLSPSAIPPTGEVVSFTPAAPTEAPAVEAPLPAGTIRYEQPPDGTLQLLPGRLQIESGPGAGGEVRFVRIPGVEQEITFGRATGPAYRHVQLGSPTVSRQHARLLFRDGAWTLRNESGTNPTVHNGRALGSGLEEVLLQDGDLIEMGEIRFLFHQTEKRDRLASRSSWYTDRGRRAVNQDAVVVRTLPDGRELAAVCDGMGSHSAGGIASHVALDTLVASLIAGEGLEEAAHLANAAVHRSAQENPEQEGMGTTLVALLRQGTSYEIVNVGDSRAYRIDPGGIRQLTRDHSFVTEMVTTGRMSYEEAMRSPWKHAVTRSLGAEPEVEIDLVRGDDFTPPFLLLLTSDGVHGVLSDEEIAEVARDTPDVRDLARALGERALVRGGEDNVAAAVLYFAPDTDGTGGAP